MQYCKAIIPQLEINFKSFLKKKIKFVKNCEIWIKSVPKLFKKTMKETDNSLLEWFDVRKIQATIADLQMEGATSQGMWAALRNEKMSRNGFCLRAF